MVALLEGPHLLLAKVKDAYGQDWYICNKLASSNSDKIVMVSNIIYMYNEASTGRRPSPTH